MNSIIIYDPSKQEGHPLLPVNAKKNTRDRIIPFLEWSADWYRPDLAAYADYCRLERGWSENSIAAHLSTIRGRYRKLLTSNDLRDQLLKSFPEDTPIVDRIMLTNELLQRIENAMHPNAVELDLISKQDNEPHVRLSKKQVQELLGDIERQRALGHISEAQKIRDFALIRLMLGTGIREEEAANLVVDDLYQEYEGYPALEVQRGKGSKQRMVLYGELKEWVLEPVEEWLTSAGISDGKVFRGFYRNHKVKPSGLNKQSITNQILKRYGVTHRMKPYSPTAHDFRYTYARRLHDSGMPLEAIQRNMGHSKVETTLRYIGDIAAHLREPRGDLYG